MIVPYVLELRLKCDSSMSPLKGEKRKKRKEPILTKISLSAVLRGGIES